jgi:transcriptional regulator with XRE-family HTH domain
MKPVQLKMARAAVGWGVRELAKKAGVTANTVTRIENGADAKQSTMDRLQHALEAAGIEFIQENGAFEGGPRKRVRRRRLDVETNPIWSGSSSGALCSEALHTERVATL